MIQALIDLITRIWWALVPFSVIDFNERGLRVRLGKSSPEWELEPGWYWRWWVIEKIITVPATEDFIDLPFGDMPTGNADETITFSANVGYKVLSPYKLWSRVGDPDENLSRLALGKLAELVAQDDGGEMAKGQRAVRTWLRDRLRTETDDWGVQITKVFITTWIRNAKPIRLLTEGATTSLVID